MPASPTPPPCFGMRKVFHGPEPRRRPAPPLTAGGNTVEMCTQVPQGSGPGTPQQATASPS
eukprot:3258075-Rhodomonas_salina.1